MISSKFVSWTTKSSEESQHVNWFVFGSPTCPSVYPGIAEGQSLPGILLFSPVYGIPSLARLPSQWGLGCTCGQA